MDVDSLIGAAIPLDVLTALIPVMLAFMAAGLVLPFVPWAIGRIFKVANLFFGKEV